MRIITLDINKKITSIKNVGENYIKEIDDIETNLGEMGQIQQLDGSFIDDTTPIVPPIIQPTNQEVMDMQITMMSGIADIYMAQLGF